MPPAGVTPFSVIVPLAETSSITEEGEIVKAETDGGVTVTEADSVEPPADAVNVIVADFDTGNVVIKKLTVF